MYVSSGSRLGLRSRGSSALDVALDDVLPEGEDVALDDREADLEILPLGQCPDVVLRLVLRLRLVDGPALERDDREGDAVDVDVLLGQQPGVGSGS